MPSAAPSKPPSDSSALLHPVVTPAQPPAYATFGKHPAADKNALPTSHDQASFLSRLLFSYAYPVLKAGNERQLNQDDLWAFSGDQQLSQVFTTFHREYLRQDGALARAIVRLHAFRFVFYGLAELFSAFCASVLAPAVLHHVITAFAAPQVDLNDLALWLTAFFGFKILDAVLASHWNFHREVVVIGLVSSLKMLLFRKAVHSHGSSAKVELSNLLTIDSSHMMHTAFQINKVWILPLQVAVVVAMLYALLGLAAFAGLAVIAVSMLASMAVAHYSGAAFSDMMQRRDVRMKTIKELFGAIQVVKLNAWEGSFARKIHKLRAIELSAVAKYMYLSALSVFVMWSAPIFVSAVSFAVYTMVLDQTLTAAQVFTAIALFNVLRDPLRDLPRAVQKVIQARVVLGRMSEFLAHPNYEPQNVTRDGTSRPSDVAICVGDGTFGWTKEKPVLNSVNLMVKKGDLAIVHGAVGAGKSSLCSALLGEMEKVSGSVFVRGRVAYYSQQPWIQNRTIRENIVFGQPFNRGWYESVVQSCGLIPDLEQFPGGDLTEIGQKGVTLSGGQKARIALARACYSDADVLILDSPLAAVDAVVQNDIFKNCICDLLHTKTVVLVTHNADILASEAVDVAFHVQNGHVTFDRRKRAQQSRRLIATAQVSLSRKVKEELASIIVETARLTKPELREEGRVSNKVFMEYFNSFGGLKMCLWLLAIGVLGQAFQISSDVWLSHWTGQKGGEHNQDSTAVNMEVYALLGAGAAAMVLVRSTTVACAAVRASRHIFAAMIDALLHTPLRHFDANPIGRLLNRCSEDMSAVDFTVPTCFGNFLTLLLSTLCHLAIAAYAINFLGALVVPVVYLYVKLGSFTLASSREIARLWLTSRSPILSHARESEEGAVVIRAYGSAFVDRAIDENMQQLSVNCQAWYSENITGQWFQLRMRLLGSTIVAIVLCSAIYFRDLLSPGWVGLAFAYALSVDISMADLVEQWSWVEVAMVSTERVLEYAALPPEGNQSALVVEPVAEWPQHGSIQFDNVVFNYKEGGAPVLKGLSFDIKSDEKIGIVGRTGAGKSSLTMALFRINELVSGRILIDGVDIATMPLHTLRSRMSIIPQSPVLFKGTLRAYMDPFDEFTDADVWSAFEKVDMKEQVGALENQLSFELSENGENFSVGERQMLCMARALLTRSRIVVMDEATASIDHATEKKLQEMITRDFQDATVLTIAHRLATVLESDRIMVLSDGKVVEFASPKELVQDPSGVFYELAKEGGCLESLYGGA
ncbi:hypothetical protein BBJ28_00021082 [Nothophytophthora sp. Chile5]|nr:hypothetical protein BBJ28_00021082 [Nothophytophthora sp. Chile5]